MRIWDVETRSCVKTFSNIEPTYPNLVVALGGAKFAFAIENTICIRNLNEFERWLFGHTSQITALKWLGNSMLASGSTDGTIRIWQIVASVGECCLATFTGHTNRIGELTLLGEVNAQLLTLLRPSSIAHFFHDAFRLQTILLPSNLTGLVVVGLKSIGKDNLAIVYPNKIRVWNVVCNTFLPDLSFSQEEEEGSKRRRRSDSSISLLQSHGDSTLIGVVDSTIIAWDVSTGERKNTASR